MNKAQQSTFGVSSLITTLAKVVNCRDGNITLILPDPVANTDNFSERISFESGGEHIQRDGEHPHKTSKFNIRKQISLPKEVTQEGLDRISGDPTRRNQERVKSSTLRNVFMALAVKVSFQACILHLLDDGRNGFPQGLKQGSLPTRHTTLLTQLAPIPNWKTN